LQSSQSLPPRYAPPCLVLFIKVLFGSFWLLLSNKVLLNNLWLFFHVLMLLPVTVDL
jgi:hypothetical protein